MKTKVNKFLAVLTCITMLLSVAVPIVAVMSTGDDCCDDEHHAHTVSEPAPPPPPPPPPPPEPKNDPAPEPTPKIESDTETGSGGGSSDEPNSEGSTEPSGGSEGNTEPGDGSDANEPEGGTDGSTGNGNTEGSANADGGSASNSSEPNSSNACDCSDCACGDNCECADCSKDCCDTEREIPSGLMNILAAMGFMGFSPSSIGPGATFYARGTAQFWSWQPNDLASATATAVNLTQSGSYTVEFNNPAAGHSGSFSGHFPDNSIMLRLITNDIDTTDVTVTLQSVQVTGSQGGTTTINQALSYSTTVYCVWTDTQNTNGYQYNLSEAQLNALGELAPGEKIVFRFSVTVDSSNTPGGPVDLDGTEQAVNFNNMQASSGGSIAQGSNANETDFTMNSGYGPHAFFDIVLDANTTLSDYHSLTFTFQGISGDVGWKTIQVIAAPTTSGLTAADNPSASISLGSHNYATNGATPIDVTIPITASNGAVTTIGSQKAIRIGIYIWAAPTGNQGVVGATGDSTPNPTVFRLSNIKLNLPPVCLCTYNEAHVCITGCGQTHPSGTSHNSLKTVGSITYAACSICDKAAVFTTTQSNPWPNQWGGRDDDGVNGHLINRGVQLDPRNTTLTAEASRLRVTLSNTSITPSELRLLVQREGFNLQELTATPAGAGVFVADIPAGFWPTTSSWANFGLRYAGTTPFTFTVELLNADGDVVFDKDGVHTPGGNEPPPVAGTTYTWAEILSTFFTYGGGHGADVSVAATVGGIILSGRTQDHEGLGINIAALRALNDNNKEVVITVEVAGGTGWGPRVEIWLGGTHSANIHQGSGSSVTIPAADAIGAGTSHRLIVNGSTTPVFTVTGITVGGLSIVQQGQGGAEPCVNHNFGAHGRCNTCNEPCSHPGWANGACNTCAMPCSHPGWNNGVCTRCNITHNHTAWTSINATNHECVTCGFVQAHSFPAAGGQCTANGCFATRNAAGEVEVVYTPCGICGTVGPWRWGGNAGSHWADNCACTGYAPHTFNASGRCVCGATGTPTGAASACGMCGTVGPWRWGGNADVHWAENCSCSGYESHSFNASGVCRCGARGTPGAGGDSATGSPCGMCGVVGPWRWGGNADVHWAENCNCTGNSPHSFDASGRCICGATSFIAAPQDAFLEENFMDADSLIDDLRRAIEAGETPTINLTTAGSVTVISADVLREIAALGVDVMVILPNGFTFMIIASSISDSVGAFDLGIDVLTKHDDTQLDTIGGGKVDVAANSIVFMPNFHGEFGFEIVFHVTAEQIDYAGIDAETVKQFHVCAAANVTDKDDPTVNPDGSVNFPINHASFHVLSNERPVTAEIGTNVIGSDVVEDATIGGTQGAGSAAASAGRQSSTVLSQRDVLVLVIVSAAVVLTAAGAGIITLRRRRGVR